MVRQFRRSVSGNFALLGAILAPVVIGSAGGMIDYHIYRNAATALQDAADSAALAAAKESLVQGWSKEIAASVADNYFKTNLQTAGITNGKYSIKVDTDTDARRVTVEVTQDEFGYLMIGWFKQTPYITATATAQAVSDANLCIVGIFAGNTDVTASIHLDNGSRIDSPECGIYAESNDRYGFRIDNGSQIRANVICSVGGFYYGNGKSRTSVKPRATRDCPRNGDPLEARMPPSVGACDHTDKIVTVPEALEPGVYCGGLTIEGNYTIDLPRGIYTIKDGPLIIDGDIDLSGRGVGFHLTGDKSTFFFGPNTGVELTAPVTGEMAGLLFYEDRTVPHSFDFKPCKLPNNPRNPVVLPDGVRLHTISSNDARLLEGTFYLPKSVFRINSNAPVADKSAYTAIITGRLWLQRGPTLVLNADYATSTVPIPDGIGPREKGIRLMD